MSYSSLNWFPWYEAVLDGLVAAIEAADVQWATDGTNEPWIVQGQRRPSGIDYPHAMVLQFRKRRDEAESERRHELHRIDSTVAVFREGDPHRPEENLRQAVKDMAAVETALYDDRSLGGAADYLVIDESNAFSLENASGTTETVGDVQLTITKRANQP